MTKLNKSVLLAAILSLPMLSGCSAFADKKLAGKVQDFNNSQSSRMPEANQDFDARLKARTVGDRPYISGKSVPKARQKLPPPFYLTYSIGIDKNQSLASIAGEVTRLSGISVRISADVTTQQTMGGAGALNVSQVSSNVWGESAPVDYSNATLADILNGTCSRLGVDWEYDEEAGVINISRLTTRVFYVPISSSQSTQTASVGKTGSAGTTSGGSGSSTSSTSNSTINSAIDPWAGMKDLIGGMLTDKGKVTVNASMNTIVVTDIKQSVDRIGTVIARFVKQNTQSMLFRVDVIGVVNSNQNEVGVDWSLMWDKMSALAPNASITMSGAPQFAAASGGNIGFTITPPTGGVPGSFDGTKLVMGALSTIGRTSVVNSTTVPAMNNRLVSLALTDQTNYIESTTTAGGSGTGASSVGLNAATITTGFILNMIPLVTETSDIIVQFSMDSSTLTRMDSFSSAGQTVQQPSVTSTQMALSPRLREGATTVLTGYTRIINSDDKQSALPNMLVGGGKKAAHIKQNMLILITPIAVN